MASQRNAKRRSPPSLSLLPRPRPAGTFPLMPRPTAGRRKGAITRSSIRRRTDAVEPDGTGLSSNTLFHFTSSFENVISILKREFRPNFSLERLVPPPLDHDPADIFEAAIPMVCFCDVPLSQARYHLDTYGNYAIGMAKKWGEQYGITPVLYAFPNSGITHSAWRVAIRSRKLARSRKDLDIARHWEEVEGDIDRILYHTKEYRGLLQRAGMPPKPVRFYDEREWRYVPETDPRWLPDGALSKEEFANDALRAQRSQELWDRHVLKFTPNDIRYIIVASEAEIVPMAEQIWEIKAKYEVR